MGTLKDKRQWQSWPLSASIDLLVTVLQLFSFLELWLSSLDLRCNFNHRIFNILCIINICRSLKFHNVISEPWILKLLCFLCFYFIAVQTWSKCVGLQRTFVKLFLYLSHTHTHTHKTSMENLSRPLWTKLTVIFCTWTSLIVQRMYLCISWNSFFEKTKFTFLTCMLSSESLSEFRRTYSSKHNKPAIKYDRIFCSDLVIFEHDNASKPVFV